MAEQISDPFQMWREWRSESERQMNSFLNDAMATEQFSRGMGQVMDVSLNLQKTMSDSFGRYLSAFNMPSRTDVLDLANRLTYIEERLSSIEATLVSSARAVTAPGVSAVAVERERPPRTKKPA